MAVFVQTVVPGASRAESDAFDAAMEAAMATDGGPPAGLMVHVSRPEGDGFAMCQVRRTEDEMRAYYERTVLPHLAGAGRRPGEPTVSPVWTFARP